MIQVGDQLEVFVDKLSFGGGRGVARKDGLVIFIPYSAPQEKLLVEITKKKKSFAEAKVIQIIEPSPYRVKAPCEYYGKCGGCNWQHIDYSAQVAQKLSLLSEFFSKFEQGIEIQKMHPSPKEFHYRNRGQFFVKDRQFHLSARGKQDRIPVQQCLIMEKNINNFISGDLIKSAAEGEATKNHVKQNTFERIELFVNEAGEVRTRKKGQDFLHAPFSQVNTQQNLVLQKELKRFVEKIEPSFVLDLYCGNGNLCEPLVELPSIEKIIGVEWNKDIDNSKAKFEIVNESVEDYLKAMGSLTENSLIILDPPRDGSSPQALSLIKNSLVEHIIYVSCDPATLRRDLQLLLTDYRIEGAQGFDMFPQTDHIESMTLLKRI